MKSLPWGSRNAEHKSSVRAIVGSSRYGRYKIGKGVENYIRRIQDDYKRNQKLVEKLE